MRLTPRSARPRPDSTGIPAPASEPALAPPGAGALATLYPQDAGAVVAGLLCLWVSGLALPQLAGAFPALLPASQAYAVLLPVLVAAWGLPGLAVYAARRQAATALQVALCVAAFVVLQTMAPAALESAGASLPPPTAAPELYFTATPTPTPTPPPTLTPTPLPDHMIGVVNVNLLNVRSGPGTRYPVRISVGLGGMLEVYGRDESGEWIHVAPGGRRWNGWIMRKYMDLPAEPWALPIEPAP